MPASNRNWTYDARMCQKLGDRCPQEYCPIAKNPNIEAKVCMMKLSVDVLNGKNNDVYVQREDWIKEALSNNPGITIPQIVKDYKISETYLRKILDLWLKKGKVEKVRARHGCVVVYKWYLAENYCQNKRMC